MRNKDFIPRSDHALYEWGGPFVRGIAADQAAFDIPPAEVAECEAAWERFQVAWWRAVRPETAGRMATLQKNMARREFVAICRRLAARVRVSGATSVQRFTLGLGRANEDRPQTSRVPAEVPLLIVEPGGEEIVRLGLRPPPGATGPARPRNTAGALVFVSFGEAPFGDRHTWSLIATTTTRRAIVKFKPEDAARGRAWLRACWISPTLRRGRMSQAVEAHVLRAVPPGAAAPGTVAPATPGVRRAA